MTAPLHNLADLYFPEGHTDIATRGDCFRFVDMLAAALLARRENNVKPILAPPSEADENDIAVVRAFADIWSERISAAVFPQIKMFSFLRFCAMIAAMPDIDHRYEQVYSTLLNDKTAYRPNLFLAAELFSFIGPIDNDTLSAVIYNNAL
jgi:hypothetical protein